MMVDHGLLSWTSCAEMSEGADGSENVSDQWIRRLPDRRGQHHCKEGLNRPELGQASADWPTEIVL